MASLRNGKVCIFRSNSFDSRGAFQAVLDCTAV